MAAVRVFDRHAKAYLRALPAVASVTDTRIYYTDAFREEALSRYEAGESPVRIFREAGLEPKLIGYKRVERCFARWRQTGHLDQPRSAAGLPDGSLARGAGIPEDVDDPGGSEGSSAAVAAGSGSGPRSRKPGRPRSKAPAPLDPP